MPLTSYIDYEASILEAFERALPNYVRLEPKQIPLIRHALIDPFRMEKFANELLDSKPRRISLVVTDKTRPTPLRELLTMLLPNLVRQRQLDIDVVFATGTHEMTLDDAVNLVGSDLSVKMHVHDASHDLHINLGKTPGGVPIELLSRVVESDAIVLIGMVIPHPWSGFSGGAKLLLPGISSRRSIVEHHLKYYAHPYTLPAIIEGNPFKAEIDFVGKQLKKYVEVYAVNVVAKRESSIYGAVGELFSSYENAVSLSRELYVSSIKDKYDVLVLDARPLNLNLYQSVKAVLNNVGIANKNSLIVLIASNNEGYGPVFEEALKCNEEEATEQLWKGRGNIVPYIVALHLKDKVRDKQVVILTKGITPVSIENIRITNNLQEVLNEVLRRVKLGEKVALTYRAASTVYVAESK